MDQVEFTFLDRRQRGIGWTQRPNINSC